MIQLSVDMNCIDIITVKIMPCLLDYCYLLWRAAAAKFSINILS